MGGSPRVREDPLGTSLSAKKVSENLEKVPRIWEVEGPRGPRFACTSEFFEWWGDLPTTQNFRSTFLGFLETFKTPIGRAFHGERD